jgi:ABC-type arginine/histidine transport system permease subunit
MPYSEYYCYGVITLGLLVSLVVMFGLATKDGNDNRTIQMVARIFKTCTPGSLIIIQLIFLIVLFIINNDKIYESENLPPMFSTFNNLCFIFLAIQLYLYMQFMDGSIKRIEFGDMTGSQWVPVYLPAFILAAVWSSGCIAELWVIITKFTTDG